MGKDAYWFRHDSNAQSDPKMIRLIGKYGCAGYGAFWRVIEFIHAHCDGRLTQDDVDVLAVEYRYPDLRAMVDDCCTWGLFQKEPDAMVSRRLMEELEMLAERKDASRNASRMRWASDMRRGMRGTSVAECAADASRNAQTEKTDREDIEDRQTEKTDRDLDERKQEIGDRGCKGKGVNSDPPTADPAGVESPAGRPGESEADPDAAQDLPPSVLPLHELPDKLRAATERARARVEADAKRKADHLAQKTADYHSVKQPVNGSAAAPRASPAAQEASSDIQPFEEA